VHAALMELISGLPSPRLRPGGKAREEENVR
jgi:hypothetical protein